jgi:hypothetical protein
LSGMAWNHQFNYLANIGLSGRTQMQKTLTHNISTCL